MRPKWFGYAVGFGLVTVIVTAFSVWGSPRLGSVASLAYGLGLIGLPIGAYYVTRSNTIAILTGIAAILAFSGDRLSDLLMSAHSPKLAVLGAMLAISSPIVSAVLWIVIFVLVAREVSRRGSRGH